MRYLLATAAYVVATAPACAEDFTLKPIAELRLRYEHVDQDALPDTRSTGVTARARAGLSAIDGGWSATIVGQGTTALDDHYYDGLHGAATRPQISDPQNIALYIAQLQYKAKAVTLTAGRQKITLDDERFIGNAGFRDNAQTFDAVRGEFTPISKLKIDLTYAWGARTIWGIDGFGARQQAISGDNVFANVSYATRYGTLTGFAYLVDQDERLVLNYQLSSQTYGARFNGGVPLSKGMKLSYVASYAHQSDYHRNPNRFRADYYLGEATLDLQAVKLMGGYEVLGADNGVALTSFYTPLGTNFKFQGWADKFLAVTPPNGVRDLYASAGYGWKAIGPAKNVLLQVVYHDFKSDRLDLHYGTEWDALLQAKFGKVVTSIRYADYRAKALFTNTRKVWLQLDWAL